MRPLEKVHHGVEDVLFFLHIGKSGGLSLISYLDQQFRPEEILPLHSAPDPESFRRWSPEQLAKVRLVRGHFEFGLGDAGIFDLIHHNPILLTMLRNPVRRVVSAYYYIRSLPGHPAHHAVTAAGLSLCQFVEHPAYSKYSWNCQTMQILRTTVPGKQAKELCFSNPEAALRLAKQRLQQFSWVGITERYEESLMLLSYIFNWDPPQTVPHLNRSEAHSLDRLDEVTNSAIRRQNELDEELYTFAAEMFNRRYSEMRANLMIEELPAAAGI